jgi:hypothetical protein
MLILGGKFWPDEEVVKEQNIKKLKVLPRNFL